jgi:hypothetical protein
VSFPSSVADDELPTAEEPGPYVADGRAWVAVDEEDTAVGYLIADVVDGLGHIEQGERPILHHQAMPARILQWVLAVAGSGLVVAGAICLGLAATSSGADCTFDNFSCRSNHLLGDALRCLAGAVVVGALTLLVHRRRGDRQRHALNRPPEA